MTKSKMFLDILLSQDVFIFYLAIIMEICGIHSKFVLGSCQTTSRVKYISQYIKFFSADLSLLAGPWVHLNHPFQPHLSPLTPHTPPLSQLIGLGAPFEVAQVLVLVA